MNFHTLGKEIMFDKKFLGIGTVGERGQVAIPTGARKHCNVESGEKLAFFGLPHNMGFLVVKTNKISEIVEHMTNKSKEFEKIIKETEKPKNK